MEKDVHARLKAAPLSGPGNLDRRDAGAACALIALPLALYLKAAAQFWSGDDTQILKHTLSHSLAGILTVPAEWRELSWLYFTPLVDLSTKLDLSLFGLEPHGWYLRHLLVLGVAASLLYVFLRGWVGRVASAAAALFLLAGPPVAEVARQLWARHYVEGLAFALAALLLFRRAVARGSWPAALAAGASGLAAMLGKEVYAVVPLVALALPCETFRRRLRAALPLVAALAIYLPWRHAMVGYWGGIGKGAESLLEPARRTATSLGTFPAALAGMPAAAGLALAVLALVLLRPSLPQSAMIVFVAALVLAPLSVLRDAPAGRYALVPVVAAAALAAAAAEAGLCAGGVRGALGVLLLAGILVPAAVKGRAVFAAAAPLAARSRTEALFFERQSARGDVLYHPVEPGWYFEGLAWLRSRSHGRVGGSVVYDASVLCDGAGRDHIFAFEAASGDVVRDPPGPAAEIASVCSHLDRMMPISADLTYRESTLTWRLGPDQSGTWAFLSDEAAPFSVAREGSLFIRFTGDVNLRVRHETADGRLGLSPALTLHVRDGSGEASLTESRKTLER
ncbi:MAG: hypothetical protein ACHQM4_02100 [Thermoanaerobaculia bacterium]